MTPAERQLLLELTEAMLNHLDGRDKSIPAYVTTRRLINAKYAVEGESEPTPSDAPGYTPDTTADQT